MTTEQKLISDTEDKILDLIECNLSQSDLQACIHVILTKFAKEIKND